MCGIVLPLRQAGLYSVPCPSFKRRILIFNVLINSTHIVHPADVLKSRDQSEKRRETSQHYLRELVKGQAAPNASNSRDYGVFSALDVVDNQEKTIANQVYGCRKSRYYASNSKSCMKPDHERYDQPCFVYCCGED